MRLSLLLLVFFAFVSCVSGSTKKTNDSDAAGDALVAADQASDADTVTTGCGNGIKETGELCETTETKDCTKISVVLAGTATCKSDCSGFDTSTCEKRDICADNNGGCGDPSYATCQNTETAWVCTCTGSYIPTKDDKKCVPRYDFGGPTYHGDMLLVVNEDPIGENSAFAGTLPKAAAKVMYNRSVSLPSMPLSRVLPLPSWVSQERRLENRSIQPLPDPAVGEVRKFWVSDLSTGKNSQIDAEAVHVGSKCILWSQRPVRVSKTEAKGMGDEFDTKIHKSVSDNFYTMSDVDGNGKITMLFLDLKGQAGGYFNPYDLYDYADSNKTDMIYVEQDYAGTGYDSVVLAHEFQHLVHNNRDRIEEKSGEYYSWIGEGLSTSSEHVYLGFRRDWLSAYNDSDTIPDGLSVTYFDWSTGGDVANYGLTYLFHQYLRIQAGQGNAVYREIIENANNNYQAYEALIQKYIDPKLSFGRFLTNFRLALLMNEKTGLYGFNSESGFKGFAKHFYTGDREEVYLRGGGALLFKLTGPFISNEDSDSGIVFVGVHSGTKTNDNADTYEK